MRSRTLIAGAIVLALLTACVTMPSGPSVMVLPGTGVSFAQFRNDDFECRQFALNQIGGANANASAENRAVSTAAAGTAIGAAAGGLLDGSREGAEVGAGAGLIAGSAMGANAAGQSSYALQQQYDFGYIQCMYAKGDQVPVYGHPVAQRTPMNYGPPPPGSGIPPLPPAGLPPG
jgi:hypothetical protein